MSRNRSGKELNVYIERDAVDSVYSVLKTAKENYGISYSRYVVQAILVYGQAVLNGESLTLPNRKAFTESGSGATPQVKQKEMRPVKEVAARAEEIVKDDMADADVLAIIGDTFL